MGRHQVRKGYTRRQQDKQLDREKIAYQKAEKKGIRGLMDEIQQLKAEVAQLDSLLRAGHDTVKRKEQQIGKLKMYLKIVGTAGLLGWGYIIGYAVGALFL